MNFQSTIVLRARSAQSLLSTAGICLLLLIILQCAAAARAQVTFNGALTTQSAGFVSPSGVAVDAGGDLFVTDVTRTYITELPIGGGAPIPLGSGFSSPQGIAVDAAGNLYVADKGNNAVKQIVAAGGYTTINTLGSGFNQPFGVAVDASGNILVADTSNSQVKEIFAAGGYTTISVLGGGITFSEPEGVNLDQFGNLYIADRTQTQIVELTASSGYATASYRGSGLNSPRAVSADISGNIFVVDKTSIREITAASNYVTVLTLNGSFNSPYGVAVDANDNIYIADAANSRIATLALVGINFANQAVGSATAGIAVPFSVSAGTTIGEVSILTTGATGLDFADAGGSTCTAQTYSTETNCQVNVKFSPRAPGLRRGAVNIYDGSGNILASVPIYGVGTGSQVTYQPGTQTNLGSGFSSPNALAVDASGNIFLADTGNAAVKKIPAGGGAPVSLGSGFQQPRGIAVDGAGNLFVTDFGASTGLGTATLYEVLAAGGYTTVKTLATGLSYPRGVAVDANDNVYIAGINIMFELLSASGYTIMHTMGAQITDPLSIALDVNGNLFVTSAVSPDGAVFELFAAGGFTTGRNLGGGLISPLGVAVDAAGNVYVSDGDPTYHIHEFLAAGGYSTVRTLAGLSSAAMGVAVDAKGNVYFPSSSQTQVTKLDLVDPPSVVFPTPTLANSEDTTDGPQTLGIWNVGNQPLVFTTPETGGNPSYPAMFPENSSDTNLCSAGLSVAVAASCDVSLNFEPTAAGALSGSVVLADNALNVAGATQTIRVSGTGLAVPTSTKLTATPTTVSAGHPETLSATVTSTGGTPTGTVSFLVDGVQTVSTGLVSGNASATITLDAGTHSITASYPAAGPYLASSSSAVTVTAVNATISVYSGSGQTAVYGALFSSPLSVALLTTTGQPLAGKTITFTGKGVALSSTTALTNVDGIASITTSAASVGSESVVASYDTFTTTFALTGTKAPLTFTASNVTVPLGQPISSLPYSVAGFVKGDSPAVVTGSPAETTTGVQGSPAATYPITIAPGSLATTNYSFIFVPGTLTIAGPGTPASIAITSGEAQTTPVSTLFSSPLTVLVKSSSGKPVEGVSVSFVGSGTTVSQASVLTNASGLASIEAVPTQPGPVSVQAKVAGTSLTATITGTGSAVVANPTTLNFGTIASGTTEVLTLTLTNYGVAGTIMVGTAINGPSYKIVTTSQNTCLAGIKAAESCIVPVEFDPVSAATNDDILTLTPSGGAAPSTVSLKGIAD